MPSYAVWLLAIVAAVGVLFLLPRFVRWFMINLLFGAALPHVARVSAALLGPTIRALAVDRAQLQIVLDKVGAQLLGQTVTFEVMGTYTAAEQQDMVEGIADGLMAVLGETGLTVPADKVGTLLQAIVARVFA